MARRLANLARRRVSNDSGQVSHSHATQGSRAERTHARALVEAFDRGRAAALVALNKSSAAIDGRDESLADAVQRAEATGWNTIWASDANAGRIRRRSGTPPAAHTPSVRRSGARA